MVCFRLKSNRLHRNSLWAAAGVSSRCNQSNEFELIKNEFCARFYSEQFLHSVCDLYIFSERIEWLARLEWTAAHLLGRAWDRDRDTILIRIRFRTATTSMHARSLAHVCGRKLPKLKSFPFEKRTANFSIPFCCSFVWFLFYFFVIISLWVSFTGTCERKWLVPATTIQNDNSSSL